MTRALLDQPGPGPLRGGRGVASMAGMDHRSFLAAIAEQPGADVSRRVYADWLDEHGEPDRAEFIRLQLLLAETDEYAVARPALAGRERELLVEHGMNWSRPLVEAGALDWTFCKGTPGR